MLLKKSTKKLIVAGVLLSTVYVIGCNNAEKKAEASPAGTEVAPVTETKKTPPDDTATIRPPKPPTVTSPTN